MIFFCFCLMVASSMLSFPILSIEKKIQVLPNDTKIDGSVMMTKIPIKEISYEELIIQVGIGYPAQIFNLGLDLNHDFSAISFDGCYCHNTKNKYKQIESANLYMYSTKATFDISSNLYEGFWARDNFLINNKYINNTDFILITRENVSDSDMKDGFFGLGLEINSFSTFFESSLSNNFILEKKFSVYINNPNITKKQSTLTLGYWDSLQFAQEKSMKRINAGLNGSYWMGQSWFTWINRNRIYPTRNMYFDLNSPYIKLGYTYYNTVFLPELPKGVCSFYYLNNQKLLICLCDYSFPNIIFEAYNYGSKNQNFTIGPESYLNYEGNGYCTILVVPNTHFSDDVLGLPFFRTYYSMFDISQRTIWIQESINNEYKYNKRTSNTYQSGLAIFILVSISLGVYSIRKRDIQVEESYERIY